MHILGGGPLEEWRPGVTTRMVVSGLVGSRSLCVFEQFCMPGAGAPLHRHDVEEVLTVLSGVAEVWLDDATWPLAEGQAVVVAAGVRHGFRNVGTGSLHVQAILAAAHFEATFDDGRETSLRWG